MANRSKNKGDRAEREAVALLQARMPDIAHQGAKRELGAGRKEDIGDIVRVVPETVIQVKSYATSALATGLRSAAKGASAQLGNAVAQGYDMRFAVGLVPIPNAPTSGAVRWMATCEAWPVDLPVDPVRFNAIGKLVTWLKDDLGPHGYLAHERVHRIASFGASLTDTVLVAPIEAWIAAYRQATGRFEPVPDLAAPPLHLVDATTPELLVSVDIDDVEDFDFAGGQAV